MPLTAQEQKVFNRAIDEPKFELNDKLYLEKLAKVLYELTGNETMKTKLDWIVEKL